MGPCLGAQHTQMHATQKRWLPLMKKGRLQQEWMPLFQQADRAESARHGNVYSCERKGQPGGTVTVPRKPSALPPEIRGQELAGKLCD